MPVPPAVFYSSIFTIRYSLLAIRYSLFTV
jgi:hypothetical protein